MTEASRHNEGKPQLSQLHHFKKGLEALAAHCSAGREKYPDADGVPNWTLGGKPDDEYLDAAERHLGAIVRGETYDVETGTLHAAAVAWNMLAFITLNHDGPVSTNSQAPSSDLTYHDVFVLSGGEVVIRSWDWMNLGFDERQLARAAGFVEQIDGSAVRAR